MPEKNEADSKDVQGEEIPINVKSTEGDEIETSAEVKEPGPDREIIPKTSGEYTERVVRLNRVTKVVKGGKNFSFSALVVVGDGRGKLGIGLGKSNEVADAIKKGSNKAKKNVLSIAMRENTIPHEVKGKFKSSKVIMKPARPGTGVIAGGAVRALCDAAGIKNILTKCFGSRNPSNVIKAAINAFKDLRLARRGC